MQKFGIVYKATDPHGKSYIGQTMRTGYRTGLYTQKQLSERYGVDQSQISNIVNNKALVNQDIKESRK